MNIDRLQPFQNTPVYRSSRVVESLGDVYKCHYPYKGKKTARGAKRSPFYDRLVGRGARFKDVSGWEGADWYAPDASNGGGVGVGMTRGVGTGAGTGTGTGTGTGVMSGVETGVEAGENKHSWGREDWFPLWQAEHEACRTGVVVMDMSFMSKFMVQGRDAGTCLNRLCTADVDKTGVITYCQWLNDAGKMEADVTVSKLSDEKYMVVATDTMHRHVEAWMRRHLPRRPADHAFVHDCTGAYAQLNVQGPRSRQLMQLLTDSDMSNEAFPYRTAREIAVGYAYVLCARITYVGELGYEVTQHHCAPHIALYNTPLHSTSFHCTH
jgi:4-methylaminobutanoate oxidase (formaldehyde-forming)